MTIVIDTDAFTIVETEGNIVELQDDIQTFGEVEELTSRSLGAECTSIARVTLWGPDTVHFHEKTEETYLCLEGEGEILLNGRVFEFNPNTRIMIRPKTNHAARPKKASGKLVFLCISSPAFDPDDTHKSTKEVGREW